MRTIRVDLEAPLGAGDGLLGILGGGARLRVSTEVIIDDDDIDAARAAGADACRAIGGFMEGYGDVADEMAADDD